ncbi:sulfotransferase [Pseudoalteromonas xiamenensis]|uniref:sulfotransferase family protein n=1 Tax=Pseudoalteromonas xiamenensis TaxID=882626 RepID=UPI0035E8A02E
MGKQYDHGNWIAQSKHDIPDFMIIGAMKSGTTTLHEMLNRHPDIAIPRGELFFFSQDDIAEHPNFASRDSHGLTGRASSEHYPDWTWYREQQKVATNARLCGEDSTTYLCSKRAITRIAMQPKPVKLIVMLRHPTLRAYSQYWHMVRARRALYSFEDTLRFMPQQLLSRSHYLSQLEWVYQHVPRAQVKVIQFETFIHHSQQVLDDVSDFLEIDRAKFPEGTFTMHENAGQLPRFLTLELIFNRIKRGHDGLSSSHFSKTKSEKRVLRALYRILNPLVNKRPPKMNVATKQYLDMYFQQELEGLDELVGQPLLATWFKSEVSRS